MFGAADIMLQVIPIMEWADTSDPSVIVNKIKTASELPIQTAITDKKQP